MFHGTLDMLTVGYQNTYYLLPKRNRVVLYAPFIIIINKCIFLFNLQHPMVTLKTFLQIRLHNNKLISKLYAIYYI